MMLDPDEQYLMESIAQTPEEEQGYVAEYYEVINEMSQICQTIMQNNKTEVKEKKEKIK